MKRSRGSKETVPEATDSANISKPPKELQNFVRKCLAGAICTFLVGFTIAFTYIPIPVPKSDTGSDRLMYTIRWIFVSSFSMLVGIHLVGRLRFSTNAINPLGGAENIVELPNRYLRNTTEQLFLHVISQLMLSTFLSRDSMKAIPILSVTFLIGRTMFWFGYSRGDNRGNASRAPGFALTFVPTVLSYLFCAYCLITSGPLYLL